MAIHSSSLAWLRSLATSKKRSRRTGKFAARRVRLERLENRYALTVPVAFDDATPADPISIEINASSFQLPVALNDQDDLPSTSLTVLVATPPSYGTLIPDPANSYAFLYTPNAGYTGADSFTYRARDVDLQTSANAATVSLFVHPRAFAGLNYSLEEGGTLALSSEGNSELNIPGSVGHGNLTYTWVIDPNIGHPFPTSLPANIFDDPRAIHTANPTLTWNDLAGWGIDNGNIQNAVVALKVTDDNGSDTDFTRLSVTNVNPELTSFTLTSLGCGTDVTLNATIFEANPHDHLTVFIDWDLQDGEVEEALGSPLLVNQGPTGATYSISVPSYSYATTGLKLPVLRVVADGGDDGNFPETFDANNLGLVTNGVADPNVDPDFPFFIDVAGGGGAVTDVTITGALAANPEGTQIVLGSAFNGGCGTPVYAWSVSKVGSSTPYQTGNGENFSFTPDDNGSYEVSLTVDGVDAAPQTIVVDNVAPSGLSIMTSSEVAGSPDVAIDGSFADPGIADSHTVHLLWDTGVTQDVPVPAGSLTFHADHTYTSTGAKIVSATVSDDDHGESPAASATSVTVQAAMSGGSLSVLGLSGNDLIELTPGSVIVKINNVFVGEFNVTSSVTVSAGDGNDTISVTAGISVPVTILGQAGNDTIVVVGTNGNDTITQTSTGFVANETVINIGSGAESATVDGGAGADEFIVSGTPPVPVQVQAVSDMVIVGTNGNDQIAFSSGTVAGVVIGKLNNQIVSQFSPTGRLIGRGEAGNDDLQVAGGISLQAWLYGGLGNDRLKGGGGNDVLLGEAGEDLLVGGNGRDLLIGGTDADRLVGDSDDDILIAGTTNYDESADALASIMAVWTSNQIYALRVLQLSCLLDSCGSNATVHDDNSKDTLTGSAGNDWFFANVLLDGGDDADTRDKITDLSLLEALFAQDIDFIQN